MIHQNSLRFYNDIAYDDYNGLVLDDNEGRHLAGTASPLTLISGWRLPGNFSSCSCCPAIALP